MEWRSARRILAVRLDNLGDVLVTTPAIRAIKRSLPSAEITLLASPVGAQAGQLNPDIADVIVYESPQMDPWQRLPHDSDREQRIIAELKRRQFDAAIIFTSFRQCPLVPAYLCYLADIPLRLAASIDGPGSLLTTRHIHPDHMMHEVERGLDLVGAIGCATDEVDLVLRVPDEARMKMSDWRLELGDEQSLISSLQSPVANPLVVVHPGCSMPARTYPWELFAEVVDLLVEQLGATVALSGTEGERELVERVAARVRPHNRGAVLPLAGELSFAELCALIERADLAITNNTGPMHVAAAVKTPVVALFALTNPPEQWGPWRVPHRLLNHDVPCRLCYKRACPYHQECLRLVTPEVVLAAAAELLEDGGGLLELAVGDAAPARVRARPRLQRELVTEVAPAAVEPAAEPAVAELPAPGWYGGALGGSWKLGADLESEEAGWRLGGGWHLGGDR
jgi:lipopolysaccharide heptosyltransferase II